MWQIVHLRLRNSVNLELLENLNKWFNMKFEIIYFYNVYGPRQISIGKMATVIGIFEDQYKKNLPLTVVKPGTQSRRFTHINDTVEICFRAWKKNMCRHYSISNKESVFIEQTTKIKNTLQIIKNFNSKYKFTISFNSLKDFFNDIIKNQSISFYGDPTHSFHVMGLLESRGMDFHNVIICSANEGVLPLSLIHI